MPGFLFPAMHKHRELKMQLINFIYTGSRCCADFSRGPSDNEVFRFCRQERKREPLTAEAHLIFSTFGEVKERMGERESVFEPLKQHSEGEISGSNKMSGFPSQLPAGDARQKADKGAKKKKL